MVRQFAYVHGIAGISLLSGKNTKCCSTVFSLSRMMTIQNPNHQKLVLHPAHRIYNGLQNRPKIFPRGVALEPPGGLSISALGWACQPKPSLHGLTTDFFFKFFLTHFCLFLQFMSFFQFCKYYSEFFLTFFDFFFVFSALNQHPVVLVNILLIYLFIF